MTILSFCLKHVNTARTFQSINQRLPWRHLEAPAPGQGHILQVRSGQGLLLPPSCRFMATPRGTAGSTGVRPHLLRALPFLVTREAAEKTFWEYQHRHPFLASAARHKQVKETFIPFWLVDIEVQAVATQAQVGHRVSVRRHNPTTRQTELVWETQWSVVRAMYSRRTLYPAEHEDMQIPATHKYIESDLIAMRPGDLVEDGASTGLLRPITSPGMLNPDRRVIPFNVRPDEARSMALSWVRRNERMAAEEFYQQAFGAQEVRFVDLDLRITHQSSHPVYIPIYVFSRDLPGGSSMIETVVGATPLTKLHTFVSGVAPGVVSGSQVYDPIKAGAAAALLTPTLLILSGLASILTGTQILILGVVLPVVGAVTIARHMPHIRRAADSAKTEARRVAPSAGQLLLKGLLGERLGRLLGVVGPEDEDTNKSKGGPRQQGGPESMEDPWVRAYEHRRQTRGYEQTQQSSSQGYYEGKSRGYDNSSGTGTGTGARAGRQAGSSWSSAGAGGGPSADAGTRGDPKGYYKLLGLQPGASQAEVQEAFRTRALQQHPDRFTDHQAKQEATAAFQKLSEAYSVLRNPNKRAQYDAGMRA